jgi:argininosuccinate lyase
VHFSQLSEDFINYASNKTITMAEAYTTGSSLMPQKKNPDACELLRGKTGRVVGDLTAMLVTLKGLPKAYNKDLQEDKEGLFDALDTVAFCTQIATGVISTVSPNPEAMRALLDPAMLATDFADYLVRKGMPFRQAHHVSGAAVKLSEDQGVALTELSLADLQAIDPIIEADVADVWDFEKSVDSRDAPGGTARSAVEAQIAEAEAWLNSLP